MTSLPSLAFLSTDTATPATATATATAATTAASVATAMTTLEPSLEVKARARKQLLESLEFIPDDVKGAFVEAMIKAPHLVELESNPDHHLEFTRYDPWKAALRLANYWKTRLHIFGKGRAFLPLTIATVEGGGAMSSEDIQVLNTGFFMVLPPQTHTSGRLVLFHDRSRLTSRELWDGRKRLRCLFYILSCMAESQTARRLGFDAIAVYTDKTRNQTMDRQLIAEMTSLVTNEILPIRQAKAHMVVLSQRPVLRNAIPLVLHVLQTLKFLDRTKLHLHSFSNEQSPEQILQELVEQHGFQAEGIPKSPLGGGFTVGCFRLWIEDRQRLELQRYAPYLPKAVAASAAVTPATTRAALLFETFQQQQQVEEDDEEEEDEEKVRKRREADAALARKKRARKQSAIKDMQDQVEFLRLQNQLLHQANDTLKALVEKAHAIVNEISRDDHPKKAQPWKMEDPGAVNAMTTSIDKHGDVTTTTEQSSGHMTRTKSQEDEVAAYQSWLRNPGLLHNVQEPQHFASRQPHLLVAHVQDTNVMNVPITGNDNGRAQSSLDSMSDPSQILLPNPLLLVQPPRILDQHDQQQQQQQHHDLQQQAQQQHAHNNIQWGETAVGVTPLPVLPIAYDCSRIRNDTTGENVADNPFAIIPSFNQQTSMIRNPSSSYIEETPPPTKNNIPALQQLPQEKSRLLLEERQLSQAASAMTRTSNNLSLYHGHVLPNAPRNPMFASSLVDPNLVAYHDNSVATFPSPHANNLNQNNNDNALPFSMMHATTAVDVPEPTPILVTGGNRGLPPPPPPASRNYFVDSPPALPMLQQQQQQQQQQQPNFPTQQQQQQQQLLLHTHQRHSQPPSAAAAAAAAAAMATLQEQDYPCLVSRGHGTLWSGAGGHEKQQVQQEQQQQEQHDKEEEEGFFHQLYEFLRKF